MAINLALNVKEYEKYLVDTYQDNTMGRVGIHYIFRFPNGYGASLIKTFGSEGYEEDLWELAVILFTDDKSDVLTPGEYDIIYPWQIVEDGCTVGCLTEEESIKIFEEIMKL